MNEIIEKDKIIENLIYEIRGKQVMLDSDLAILYKCKNGTKTINLAVKRHTNRFPERFMFQLTEEESKNIRFQIETKNGTIETRGGKYNKPFVFTEQGVAMLATVLRTEVASQMSIKIMRAFVAMRHYIGNSNYRLSNVEAKVIEHDKDIKLLQDAFQKLEEKTKVNSIFYEGQIYDSFSLLLDIFNKAKKEIIIVDNYAGKELLDILKNIDKKIIIISKNINEILKKKYQKQYNNITFKNNNTFHDRFILIDNKELYHSGASFKDLGKKCFAIYKLKNTEEINYFINKIS